eukprot:gene20156-24003_t
MLQPKRLVSIDVFRAVNMFFMIFVNDLSGVKQVPEWIDHVKANTDGMHFADTIFPLFLFIAGLSVPLAIGRRLDKGDSFASIAGYIALRSFALIVMGFFHVNLEDYNAELAILPMGVWELLMTLSFFLIWLDYPDTMNKIKKYLLIGAGVMILTLLAFLYRGGTARSPEGLSHSWWGILGIIGWAYLICSVLYFLFKGNLIALAGCLFVFVSINLISHTDYIDIRIPVVKDGASTALMMFGTVISMLYIRIVNKHGYGTLWVVFTVSGLFLILLGFAVRPYAEGISKIHSTP